MERYPFDRSAGAYPSDTIFQAGITAAGRRGVSPFQVTEIRWLCISLCEDRHLHEGPRSSRGAPRVRAALCTVTGHIIARRTKESTSDRIRAGAARRGGLKFSGSPSLPLSPAAVSSPVIRRYREYILLADEHGELRKPLFNSAQVLHERNDFASVVFLADRPAGSRT